MTFMKFIFITKLIFGNYFESMMTTTYKQDLFD